MLTLLNVPFEIISVPMAKIKEPEYTAINPNGRLPAIYDPNTDLTLWESGAIMEYLIDKYDVERQFSFAPQTNESYLAKQWLYYQTTGQGPYYGQAAVFKMFHHENLPSAVERYVKEVNRVSGVLDTWLAKQKLEYADTPGYDGPWLVANKMSYADLSFITWQTLIAMLLTKEEYSVNNFPNLKDWIERMKMKPRVGSTLSTIMVKGE